MLNYKQKDALKEYMNIYVGKAGSLLSEMINKKVNLTAPKLVFFSEDQGEKLHSEENLSLLNNNVVSSSIQFGTRFTGVAQLIFPRISSQKLVRLCLGEEDTIEELEDNLTDTDMDVLKEIGNVLLNSILGGLGNLLEVRLDYNLPEIQAFYFPEKEHDLLFNEGNGTFLITNSFSIEKVNIDGVIIMVLSMESILKLIKKLDEVMVEAYG